MTIKGRGTSPSPGLRSFLWRVAGIGPSPAMVRHRRAMDALARQRPLEGRRTAAGTLSGRDTTEGASCR